MVLGSAGSLGRHDRVRVGVFGKQRLCALDQVVDLARVGDGLVGLELRADLEGLGAEQVAAVDPGLGRAQGRAVEAGDDGTVGCGGHVFFFVVEEGW